jgi:hypothetical protein
VVALLVGPGSHLEGLTREIRGANSGSWIGGATRTPRKRSKLLGEPMDNRAQGLGLGIDEEKTLRMGRIQIRNDDIT